jgi:hypothetical protein
VDTWADIVKNVMRKEDQISTLIKNREMVAKEHSKIEE